MGISALTAFEGDLIQTRAAREANIPAIMIGSSLLPMEAVVQENPDAWFQAYMPGEDARSSLPSGCSAPVSRRWWSPPTYRCRPIGRI